MTDCQNKGNDEDIKRTLDGIKRILFVMSGKGGVGKSTVAVNLAVGLSRKGFKTGLMDTDFHGPDTLKMLGLEDEKILSDDHSLIPIIYDEGLKVMSLAGLLESRETAVIWRGPIKIGVIRQFLGMTSWGDLDFLVIDAPPGTGDEPLTVAQLIPKAEAVVVTTPQDVALLDVKKSITFCGQVQLKIAGVIENMSGFICPKCGEKTYIFGSGGGKTLAETAGVSFLGDLPIDPAVTAGGDAGTPGLLKTPESSFFMGLEGILDKLLGPVKA